MLNPNADPFFQHLVRSEHQAMLQKIEKDRLYRRLGSNQPGPLQRINHQVKAAGQWFKSRIRPSEAEPCFDGS